jgi:hypothetical protein
MTGMVEADLWVRVSALLVAALLAGLVGFQLALAAGLPWGRAAYGGQYELLPDELRVASGVAAIIWSAVALIILRRAGVISFSLLPQSWLAAAVWVVVGILVLAVVMNAITTSAIERAIWLPVSALMLIGTFVVALRA